VVNTTSRHLPEIDYGRMIRALNRLHYAGETGFYTSAGLRPCEESLRGRLGATDRVLDAGCGAGRVTNALAAESHEVVGLDVNLPALRAARTTDRGAVFVGGDMGRLPFRSGAFDRVWCLRFSFNTLPTADDRRRTLGELWRVCAPGGSVVLEAFNWHYPGRFGLVCVANLLDLAARRLRWIGQGRTGSYPLPARDLIYLANKTATAAPGYAHLTTVAELRALVASAGLDRYAVATGEAGIVSGRAAPVRDRHRGYASWLVLTKPAVSSKVGGDR
jgi:SAM-dependent methyltransferase